MSQFADFIIPECYIDTNLCETLLHLSNCNHQKGCNQVAAVMQKKFGDRFAVGIMDSDKRKPSYIKEFDEIAESPHLRILGHKQRAHFIILISPASEGFILSCAEEADATTTDFDLPQELDKFKAITKNVMSNKDSRFKNLFLTLEHHGEMKLLKSLLYYLHDNTYRANAKVIKDLFKDN